MEEAGTKMQHAKGRQNKKNPQSERLFGSGCEETGNIWDNVCNERGEAAGLFLLPV